MGSTLAMAIAKQAIGSVLNDLSDDNNFLASLVEIAEERGVPYDPDMDQDLIMEYVEDTVERIRDFLDSD